MGVPLAGGVAIVSVGLIGDTLQPLHPRRSSMERPLDTFHRGSHRSPDNVSIWGAASVFRSARLIRVQINIVSIRNP